MVTKKKSTMKILLAAGILTGTITLAEAGEVVIWHDLGDDGIQLFDDLGAAYKRDHPDTTVTSLSFPLDQWFSKVTASLNTGTAPSLIINDGARIARIQQNTGKLHDLTEVLNRMPEGDRKSLSDADIRASRYADKLVMLPVQRLLVALGARRSWLENVGEPFPETWEDLLRVSRKFQEDDPDKNGKDDTFGMALQAGNASVTYQMLELLGFGTGLEHIAVDGEGRVVLNQPRNAELLIEFMKIFTDYKIVSPDTINHTFTDMYQLIEGGRAGFFRVGDWNVKKWDSEAINGDYVIGPLPQIVDGGTRSIAINALLSIAVPDDKEEVTDEVLDFTAFLFSKEAQEICLKRLGSAVRTDLATENLPEHEAFFVNPAYPIAPNDFPESVHAWFPQFKEELYKHIVAAFANPPADWNKWVNDTAAALQGTVDELKKQG